MDTSASSSAQDPAREPQGQEQTAEPGPRNRKRRMRFPRSKGGCLSCRKLKKKCDEVRPACARCIGTGKSCAYPSNQESPGRSSTSPSRSASPRSRQSRQSATAAPHYSPDWLLNGAQVSQPLFQNQMEPITPISARSVPSAHGTESSAVPPQPVASTSSLSNSGPPLGLPPPIPPAPAILPGTAPGLPPSFPTIPSFSDPASSFDWSIALLTVPIDCEPALWASFVDSSQWSSASTCSVEDRGLLDYFAAFASVTVVVRDGEKSAARFYQELATRAVEENQNALFHAVLAVSAQHLSNLASNSHDDAKALALCDESTRHRSKALHIMRIAAAKDGGGDPRDQEVLPAVMLLLVLLGILKGDGDIIPSYLQRAKELMSRITDFSHTGMLLPTMSALHSLYSGFVAVAACRQVDPSTYFPDLDDRPVWGERADDAVETLAGVRRKTFMQFLKVHSHVLEARTIIQAMARNPNDDELNMMLMEVKSECSTIEAELRDDKIWEKKGLEGCDSRARVAQEFYRLAMRIMVISDVFGLESTHPRVVGCVRAMLSLFAHVDTGAEIGLLWPFMMVASAARECDRQPCLDFIHRCQWKGSPGPKTAERVVLEVWSRIDRGLKEGWREVIVEMGSPLII